MADAVLHIMRLLEDLIGVLCRTLEIEDMCAANFLDRAEKVLDEFNTQPPDVAQLKQMFETVSPTIIEIRSEYESPFLHTALLMDGDILTRIPNIMDVLVPDIMDQLGGMECSLEDFLNHPMLSSGSHHSPAALPQQQQPCRALANNLLSTTREFKEVITSLHQVTKEAISLHHILGTSPGKLGDSNNHGLDNHINIVVVDHAGQQLADFLTANFVILEKIDVVALKEVKHNICLLKQVYQGKFRFAAECSRRSNLLASDPLFRFPLKSIFLYKKVHKIFYTFQDKTLKYNTVQTFPLRCFCAGYEVQNTGFKVSQISSYPETGSSSDMLPRVQGAGTSLTQEQIMTSRDGDMTCLDGDMTNIIDELILQEGKLSIITIAGMGGIGKTTLAKKVFYHKKTVLHFHCLAWVSSVSNIDGALSHLLRSIASFNDEIHARSIDDKGEILRKSLKGRKYLIVMDDLWNFEAWNAIEKFFPDDNLGSRILITSRFVNFPTNISNKPPHCMRLLNENQSWEMLKILVFGEEVCPSGLVTTGRRIAGRCGGLPLAIAVIAGILRILRPSIKSYSPWSGVMDSLSDNLEGCLGILALSYKYLPSHLKACFLFMGSFPANSEIDAQKLVHLWSAESFSDASPYISEITAQHHLEELINRCLVSVEQRSLDGKIKTCSIHDLLREFCLREAKKRNFMRVLEDEATDGGLLRHLHLVFNSKNEESISVLHSHPHLRSFILLNTDFEFSPDSLLSQMSHLRRLRVLDIYFLPLNNFPPAIKHMENLTYLALNITYVLDASISCLSKLETLVVYGPWIPEVGPGLGNFPALYLDFWKMPRLRNVNVRMPSCLCFGDLPPPLREGSLSRSELRNLTTIKFSSCTGEVFCLVPNLQILGISETKEDYENGEYLRCFGNLAFLTKLQTLKCSFYRGNGLSRSLDRDVLPVSLKQLILRGSRFSWDKMKILALLPNLETLKLKDYAFQGPEWVLTEEEVFGCLKQLLIDNTDLEHWEAADDTNHFPRLNRLVLKSCWFLLEIPYDTLPGLQLIHVHNCSESVQNSAKEFQENFESLQVTTGDNPRRVVEKGGQSLVYRS